MALVSVLIEEMGKAARRATVAFNAAAEAWHKSGVDDTPVAPGPYDDVTSPTGPSEHP